MACPSSVTSVGSPRKSPSKAFSATVTGQKYSTKCSIGQRRRCSILARTEKVAIMKSYGQFCPVAKAAEVFCERWTALILRDLGMGSIHFARLQRGIPLASPTLLSRRLKQLVAEGIVERRRSGTGRSWTYHLTPAGEEFVPVVRALGVWGRRWLRRELADHEIDASLLLWAMERGARHDAFAPRRGVVKLTFSDQPIRKRQYWFVSEKGRTQLCVHDPGYEVNLYVTTTLPDMIYIWRGDLPLARVPRKRVCSR